MGQATGCPRPNWVAWDDLWKAWQEPYQEETVNLFLFACKLLARHQIPYLQWGRFPLHPRNYKRAISAVPTPLPWLGNPPRRRSKPIPNPADRRLRAWYGIKIWSVLILQRVKVKRSQNRSYEYHTFWIFMAVVNGFVLTSLVACVYLFFIDTLGSPILISNLVLWEKIAHADWLPAHNNKTYNTWKTALT